MTIRKPEIQEFLNKITDVLEGYQGLGRLHHLKDCLYSSSCGVKHLVAIASHDAYGTPIPANIFSVQWSTGEDRNSFMWYGEENAAKTKAYAHAVRMVAECGGDKSFLKAYNRETLGFLGIHPEVNLQVCYPERLLTPSLAKLTGDEAYWIEDANEPSQYNATLSYVNFRPVSASVDIYRVRRESWRFLEGLKEIPETKRAVALDTLFSNFPHIYAWLHFSRKIQ